MQRKHLLNYTLYLALLVTALVGCSQHSTGSKKRLTVSVGEIKEITLSGYGDGKSELVGTSDNQEVVEVSRQQLAPAVDTLKRNDTPTIFQIKGITVGTANVVFSKKTLGETGAGKTVRTYTVQVVAK